MRWKPPAPIVAYTLTIVVLAVETKVSAALFAIVSVAAATSAYTP